MRITGTHHVALVTPNFARLREFYTGTLGLPVVGGFPGHNIIFIAAGGTTIELEEQEPAPPAGPAAGRGWQHLAFAVEDVEASYAELAALGVPFTVPPMDFPEDAPVVRTAFFTDPDGNTLELIQPLGDRPYGSEMPPAPVQRHADGAAS
jgi:glyoxylase I family protein